MLELDYFVLYSEFLSLELSDGVEIGNGAVNFTIERMVQAAMLGPKLFDAVLRRHSTSCATS
jgi:hypothetical protein